jgi:hypothetical protein
MSATGDHKRHAQAPMREMTQRSEQSGNGHFVSQSHAVDNGQISAVMTSGGSTKKAQPEEKLRLSFV